jgi:hypothetical protein
VLLNDNHLQTKSSTLCCWQMELIAISAYCQVILVLHPFQFVLCLLYSPLKHWRCDLCFAHCLVQMQERSFQGCCVFVVVDCCTLKWIVRCKNWCVLWCINHRSARVIRARCCLLQSVIHAKLKLFAWTKPLSFQIYRLVSPMIRSFKSDPLFWFNESCSGSCKLRAVFYEY